MKRISRMLIFSAISLYLTALWNGGFSIPNYWASFFILTIIIAIIYYLVMPLGKLILLPINFLTLGLLSTVLYVGLIFLLDQNSQLIQISAWTFAQNTYFGIGIPQLSFGFLENLVVSSLCLSGIINTLEKIV